MRLVSVWLRSRDSAVLLCGWNIFRRIAGRVRGTENRSVARVSPGEAEIRKAACAAGVFSFLNGRGERIRTSDPLLPKQVLYQAEPLPDMVYINALFEALPGHWPHGCAFPSVPETPLSWETLSGADCPGLSVPFQGP